MRRMANMATGLAVVLAMLAGAGNCNGQTDASYASDEQKVLIQTAVVFSINDIEVPSQVKGFLASVGFEEGDYVEQETVMVVLNQKAVTNELESARIRLTNAERQANDNTPVDYADASMNTAVGEYNRELGLSRKGSSTPQELERKRLAMRQAELQLERSKAQKVIDAGAVDLEKRSLAAVQEMLNRHSIKAPFSGEIVKIVKRAGEFVQEGETVLRLVNSSQMKVEGRVSSARFNDYELKGKPVRVTLKMARGETRIFTGEIRSIGLEHQIGRDGSMFVVQAVVENQKAGEQWLLHPNAKVSMEIDLK